MNPSLVILGSYLLGSIPFSHLFPKIIKGHDVREKGTKNVGATNALVVGGKRAGLLALVGDIAKGIAAISLARYYFLPDWGVALSGFAAVVGHDFSIFLRFKGGKGVATAGGIFIALDPIFAILIVLIWIFAMAVIRYFIPATVLALCFAPALMWMASWRMEYIVFGVLNAGLAIYAHRVNLQLFFAGQEPTISGSLSKYLKKS